MCIRTKQYFIFVTGQYGNNNRNNRGERLRTFLGINELVSTATLFEKRNYNTWSFAGIGKDEKQIDHILVSQKNKKRIIDCYTHDNAGIISDHTTVEMKLRIADFIPKKEKERQNNVNNHNHNDNNNNPPTRQQKLWNLLLKPKIRKQYNILLANKIKDAIVDNNNTDNNTNAPTNPYKQKEEKLL